MNRLQEEVLSKLWRDKAINDAINRAKETERAVKHLQLVAKPLERRTKPAPDGVDFRQLHRQHCQPESAPLDWNGIVIALFIVGVIAAVAIGSTIDFRGL